MIYCDTSLLVAILTSEQHSTVADRWLTAQDAGDLAVSTWSDTEVASALAMKQRRGVLAPEARAATWRRWQLHMANGFIRLDVEPDYFEHAARLVDAGERGLRAGDALHLAVAAAHNCAMATLDVALADAAAAIGLKAPAILSG